MPAVRDNPKLAADKAPAVRTIAELSKGIAETERLLNMAVAYNAAENLASAYGYYLDEFMWDETADLFARDGKRRFADISSDVWTREHPAVYQESLPGQEAHGLFHGSSIGPAGHSRCSRWTDRENAGAPVSARRRFRRKRLLARGHLRVRDGHRGWHMEVQGDGFGLYLDSRL